MTFSTLFNIHAVFLQQKYGVLFPPDETLLQKAADKFNEESSWVTVGSTGFTGSRGTTGVTVSTTKERKEEEEKKEEKTTTISSSTASTTASTTATTVAETTPLWKILTTRYVQFSISVDQILIAVLFAIA